MDVEPVDLGLELRQRVQFRLALAPVVIWSPVTHQFLDCRVVPLQTPLTRGYNPTGGVLTSADDVGLYLRALLNGGGPLLSAESVKAMWTPRFRTGEKTAVGLGWMLEEVTGHQTWTWTGDIGTSGSVFLVLPDQNLGVAVMANYDAPRPLNQLAEDIVTIALGGEPPARPSPVNPSDLPAVEPDRRPWDSYVGLYAGPRDALRVMRDGDHLVAKITGGDLLATAGALGPNEGLEAQFIPTSATQFVLQGDSTVLDGRPAAFQVGPDGKMMLLFGGTALGTR